MQVYNIIKTLFCLVIISALSALISFAEVPAEVAAEDPAEVAVEDPAEDPAEDPVEIPAEDYSEETVSFENGLLSINVKNMRPEDLIKEISEKCKIELVILGEVFSEFPVSIRFKDVPVQEGLKRVLRRSNITKHLMYFAAGDNGSKIVRLDLIGDKDYGKRRRSR